MGEIIRMVFMDCLLDFGCFSVDWNSDGSRQLHCFILSIGICCCQPGKTVGKKCTIYIDLSLPWIAFRPLVDFPAYSAVWRPATAAPNHVLPITIPSSDWIVLDSMVGNPSKTSAC